MAYCTWADVQKILERASEVIPSSADQTDELALATDMADQYLAPLIPVPVGVDQETDTYPSFVVRFTALLCADQVAGRRYHGEGDTFQADYDGHLFTGTKYGHQAMGMLQARRQAKMAAPEEVTPADVDTPNLRTAFTLTTGRVQVKYAAGFYQDDKRGIYTFTFSSGSVGASDLTVQCLRDVTEEVWTDQVVTDTGWVAVECGLLVRFMESEGDSNFEPGETFTVVCEPPERVKTSGPRSVEWNLG